MFNLKNNKKCIVRIIVLYHQGDSVGTGFFITPNNILTCFHVIFGELRKIRNMSEFSNIQIEDEHLKLEEFLKQKLIKIEIELPNGQREQCSLKSFDEFHDIVILSVDKLKFKNKFLKLNYKIPISHGDEVVFCGFPMAVGYRGDKSPFAFTAGVVSSFLETQVGGEGYEHIQINGVNLAGNSGAPLFKKNSDKVIGIINGNMNHGNDNLVAYDQNNNFIRISFRIPVGITYATPIKLLQKNNILK